MAKKDEARKLREKSKKTALEGLMTGKSIPMPPRKAMSQAKKASKGLAYPLPPYPSANPLQLLRWAQEEWRSLGRWQGLAAPVILFVALRTWEKEKALQEARRMQIEKEQTKQKAEEIYLSLGRARPKKKLFGIISM